MDIFGRALKAAFIITWLAVILADPAPAAVRIFLDSGHGGRDMGAIGMFDILEKQVSLQLALLVRERLKREFQGHHLSAEVVLSRDQDRYVSLTDRVRMADRGSADIFLSIHANSSPLPKAKGFEIYFLSAEASDEAAKALAKVENGAAVALSSDVASILSDVRTTYHVNESSQFAESVYGAMTQSLAGGRGIRQAPFTVLEGTTMPAILIEVGYLTNRDDARNLQKPHYLKQLADAISQGIFQYVTLKKSSWRMRG
jgi:N-acetylmuramoyl-L-alanine amidase